MKYEAFHVKYRDQERGIQEVLLRSDIPLTEGAMILAFTRYFPDTRILLIEGVIPKKKKKKIHDYERAILSVI